MKRTFKNVWIFEKLQKYNLNSLIFQLLINLKFQVKTANKVVFHQGDRSNNFYMLLEGETVVLVKNRNNQTKESHYSWEFYKMFNKNRFFFNQNTNPKTFLHTIVKIYKSGDSFGELGIINRCNRSATIITTSNCKFASLNEEHFKPIFNLKI